MTVILSRRDGVVSWRSCLDHHSSRVEHVEVGSTHLGMVLDPDVWLTIARRLAPLSPSTWRPRGGVCAARAGGSATASGAVAPDDQLITMSPAHGLPRRLPRRRPTSAPTPGPSRPRRAAGEANGTARPRTTAQTLRGMAVSRRLIAPAPEPVLGRKAAGARSGPGPGVRPRWSGRGPRWRTAARPGRRTSAGSSVKPVRIRPLASPTCLRSRGSVEHAQHRPRNTLRRAHRRWRPAWNAEVVGCALVDGRVHAARGHDGHVDAGQVAVLDGQLPAEGADAPLAHGVCRHVRRRDVAEHRADQDQVSLLVAARSTGSTWRATLAEPSRLVRITPSKTSAGTSSRRP